MNFTDAATGQVFNHAAEFHKHIAQFLRQALAQRGLASTAQTDERNMLPAQVARLGRFFQQSDQAALQRFGHLQQHQNGGIAHPGFQIRPMALGHPGPGGGGFARQATACPQAAHPLAQGHQIGVFLGVQILTHECTLMHQGAT